MNWRVLIMISAALNVLLLAMIIRESQAGAGVSPAGADATIHRTSFVTRTVTNIIGSDVSIEPLDVVWPTWEEIAGDSWVDYRDNLLSYHCPPSTLRKIITSELNWEHFEERKRITAAVSVRFWDLVAEHGVGEDVPEFEAARDALAELQKSYEQTQRDVLGQVPEEPSVARPPEAPHYEHLGEEREAQLVALDAEYRDRRNAITRDREHRDENNRLTAEARAELNRLSAESDANRRSLMTEEEFQEYRLRVSGHANWASNLGSFEPTTEELRQVAQWRLEMDQNAPRPGRNDPDAKEKNENRRAAEQNLESDVQALLGDERYAQLKRAQDGAYRQLHDLIDVFELSESLAISAWEMRNAAIETANTVRRNDELTLVEKREALRRVQQETRDSLSILLSDEYFQAYDRKAGNWITDLARVRN
jgi:hypothetical protein